MKQLIYTFLIIFIIPSCVIVKLISIKKSPESYYSIAEQKIKEGDNLGAIKYFSKAIKDKPDYIDAYSERARIAVKEDSFNLAISDYSKLIDMKPSGELFFLRGDAYWRSASGRDSMACKDWTKSRDLNCNRAWDALRLHCKK